MTMFKFFLLGSAALTLAACGPGVERAAPEKSSEAAQGVKTESAEKDYDKTSERSFTADKFTQSNYRDVRVTHLDLDLDVDFDEKVLRGTASLGFERINPDVSELVLDTKALSIAGVEVYEGGTPFQFIVPPFALGDYDPVLGEQLTITLPPTADRVVIYYETSPGAGGLQWLTPEQTAGKTQPYLFSQAQALNARTMAPVQDTPAVRMTYAAKLRVPEGILPLMSAEQSGQDADGAYTFFFAPACAFLSFGDSGRGYQVQGD